VVLWVRGAGYTDVNGTYARIPRRRCNGAPVFGRIASTTTLLAHREDTSHGTPATAADSGESDSVAGRIVLRRQQYDVRGFRCEHVRGDGLTMVQPQGEGFWVIIEEADGGDDADEDGATPLYAARGHLAVPPSGKWLVVRMPSIAVWRFRIKP